MARISAQGSHTFAAAGSFTLYTGTAAHNTYIDYLYVQARAAIASGGSLAVIVNGNTVATLSPILNGYQFENSSKPLIVAGAGTVAISLAVATSGTFDYSLAGDFI